MRDKKVIILIVLLIFAAISLMYGMIPFSKGAAKKAYTATSESLQQAPPQELVFSQRRAKRSKFTSWKRNPFILQKVSHRGSEILILSGIIQDKGRFSAVINDKIVQIGDNIGPS